MAGHAGVAWALVIVGSSSLEFLAVDGIRLCLGGTGGFDGPHPTEATGEFKSQRHPGHVAGATPPRPGCSSRRGVVVSSQSVSDGDCETCQAWPSTVTFRALVPKPTKS